MMPGLEARVEHRGLWHFGHKFIGQRIEAVDLFQLDGLKMGLESVLIEAD